MTWMKALRAHQQGRNQSGFALATAIAILLVSSMLVTAVVGLTFATLRYSGDQVVRDRETRAAEAGVEPAIGILARATADDARGGDPTTGFILGQVGSINSTTTGTYDPCNWQPSATEDEANRPSLVQTTVDGQRVEVFCTALSANRYAPVQSSSNRMRVLGNVPAGTWQSTTTSPCLPLSKPECLPWSEALTKAQITGQNAAVAANQTAQSGARNGTGLVHTGTDPLYVVGNLDVSGGSDVLRNPDRGTGTDYVVDPPGLAVSGSYRQGDPGPLATSGNRCGVIAPPVDPAASTVAVTSTTTTTTVAPTLQQYVPGAQIDDGGTPECDKTPLRADVPSATGVAPGPVQTWTLDRIRTEDVTVNRPPRNDGNNAVLPWANYPNSCPVSPNQTIRFQPGAYPANITTVLNKWFAVCAGVKFWFTPGNYWFDANDGAGTSALKMDKASNIYVFGTPNTGGNIMSTLTKATQPMCDATKSGVNVVLSPRTVIRHTAGYGAICGDPNATNRQAIWQTAASNLGYTAGAPTTFLGGTSNSGWYDGLRNLWLVGSLVNLIFGPGSSFQNRWTSLPGGGLQMTAACASAPCNGTAAFSTTWEPPAGQDPGPATINAATLKITGEESNANDTSFGSLPATDVAVYKYNAATGTLPTTPTCRLTSPRINDSEGRQGPHTVDIDLLYPGSPCGSEIDRADLLKSRIDVAMGLNSGCDLFSLFTGCQYGVTVNSVRLETPQVLAPPAESVPSFVGSVSNGTQTNPQQVLAADGNAARFQSSSTCQFRLFVCLLWKANDTMTGTVRLPSITDRYSPALADGFLATSPGDAELQSANLRVKGISRCDAISTNCGNQAGANASPSQLRVTVRNSTGGAICDATFQRLPEWNQTRSFDLLNNCLSSGVKKLKYNRDLLGTSIDVRFDMVRDKNLITGCRAGPVFDPTSVIRNCASWTYDVDYIGVSTTVSTPANQKFDGPSKEFLVTSNDLPNVNQEGRFNVYGTVIMPRADMRVDWIGPANHIGDPIVTGPPQTGNGTNVVDTLVVGSLQSYMSRFSGENPNSSVDDPRAGIICCDQGRQAERLVELRSHVVPNTSITLPIIESTTGSTTTTTSTPTTAPAVAWSAAQQVITNCNNDNPVNLAPPGTVSAAQRTAWKTQVVTDWKKLCRTETLRAVTKVRFLDQVPANIAATSPYAAKRGAWLPGFDVEVQGWRFCKGGVLTAGALACTVS
ncbi:MAG: pilus assembly PilX family protein [Microthrixaceae bacterium]